MKSFIGIVAAAALTHIASAHYIFQALAPGTAQGIVYEYVRRNTNYNSPVTDLSSNDLRCNVGGETGGNTTTLEIKAGDPFTFTLDTAVYHQGPISIYMSKAPSTAGEYDGSGPWFKTLDIGPDFSGGQAQWTMKQQYSSTIPTCIPAGEYLLRIQSLAIHNPGGVPQFYISCGQVKVSGGGSASPSPTALIPGAFKATDPGYTANIYDPSFKSYTVPGPNVFTC
ncbi:glycosyl hydrolase family 61-domain-containing protein [Pseudomassariella vexata]|uniref:lytic cellulose monooxygenase (C4-dehydrogenating) n=1 Tax=Pseudomassariella vexata TaxID=1141098 RepID=A0A1Y2E2K2_9PEZI|nr:glycosyl hydrolase family 61-domain-containing protein [Pseudomassariella vexata]ORY65546.1 glycosyl hydrolase family 61-domain-containing protein [Pseudomassariella vexata]